MSEIVLGVLIAIIGVAVGLMGFRSHRRAELLRSDATAMRDYGELRGAMSLDTFLDIRAKNRTERERFGDGTDAPYYPRHEWNGHSTLRRGVWVTDGVRVSDRELDEFREAHRRKIEAESQRVEFTLVEGEQEAPLGKDGATIRVRATQMPLESSYVSDASGNITQYIPTVSYGPVGSENGWWSSTVWGTLPLKMSVRVKR